MIRPTAYPLCPLATPRNLNSKRHILTSTPVQRASLTTIPTGIRLSSIKASVLLPPITGPETNEFGGVPSHAGIGREAFTIGSMDGGLGIPPSDSDLAELKAQWVESVRPIIAMTPKRQRKSVSEQLRKTMGCAGWPPEEAALIVADLFS